MKKILVIGLLILIGIGCLVAYRMIGAEVLPDGTLQEPFALLPIGYLMIGVGIIAGIVVGVKGVMRKK